MKNEKVNSQRLKTNKYEVNNIYNVNSYLEIKNIPDNSIDMIYVDPPYLFQKGGSSKSMLGKRMGALKEELHDMSDGFDLSIFDEFVRIMKKINIFIWCSKAQLLDIMNYFSQYDVNFELLVWHKTNPAPRNQSWLSDLEYILVFREKGIGLNKGYHLKSKYYGSSNNVRDKREFKHPSIKPLELVKRHILHTTQPGDVVGDFFMGSGTTAVAAIETGRKYIGFEKREDYFEIAKNRIGEANEKIS